MNLNKKLQSQWKAMVSTVSKYYLVRTKMIFYGMGAVVVLELLYPFVNNGFSFHFMDPKAWSMASLFSVLFSFSFGLFYGFFMWMVFGQKKIH